MATHELAATPKSNALEPPPKPSSGWTVDLFASFWAKPSASMDRIPELVASEIIGHWPGGATLVRGAQAYWRYVVELLNLVPDFRLRVLESASKGGVHFILWEAFGTGPDGPFTCIGCDCIRTRDGIVLENYVNADHPIFCALAARVAASSRETESEGFI